MPLVKNQPKRRSNQAEKRSSRPVARMKRTGMQVLLSEEPDRVPIVALQS